MVPMEAAVDDDSSIIMEVAVDVAVPFRLSGRRRREGYGDRPVVVEEEEDIFTYFCFHFALCLCRSLQKKFKC